MQYRPVIKWEWYSKTSLCWAISLGSQHDATRILLLSAPAIERYQLQTPALSSKPAGRRCCCRSMGQTHTHSLRQTDGRTFDRYIDPALHTMRSASMKPRICAPGIHLLADSKRLKNAKRRWLKKYACWLPSSWLNEHWTGGDVSLRKVFSQQFTERNDTIQIGLQKN